MKITYLSDDPRKFDELTPTDQQSRLDELTMLAAVYEELLENPDVSGLERERLKAFLASHRRGVSHIQKKLEETD